MANKIDSSNRELIEEMIARGSSNADISKMTGVLKADIEAFRQHPEKFSRKKSLEESLKTMYPTMPGYKTIKSTDKKDTQDEPKVIPEISKGETVHESVSDITDNEVVDLLNPEPVTTTDLKMSPIDESKTTAINTDTTKRIISKCPTKLSVDNVEVIVQRLLANNSIASIATDFGVDPMTISNIRYGKSWKHVVGDRLAHLPPAGKCGGKVVKFPLDKYIDMIASDILKGYSIGEIAKKYRVTSCTVRAWISGASRADDFKDYDFSSYTPNYDLVVSDDEIIPEYPPANNKGIKKPKKNYRYKTEIPMSNPYDKKAEAEHNISEPDITQPVSDESIPVSTPLITVERTDDRINVALNVKLNCTITFNDNAIDIEWR